MKQIKFNMVLKILRLVIIIFIVSYFVGILFYIFVDVTRESPDNFIDYFELPDNDSQKLIIMLYFAFTTLTTVGYGDFRPTNDRERLIFILIFLFGTLVFSFIMGNFIGILLSFNVVSADNEDSENLSRWLGLMAKFNKGRPLPKEMTRQIENYFEAPI